MSKRRHTTDVTDPGRPPEEALDATLAALGEPVAPEARNTAESAGLDAARYHAEAHRPPRAHVNDTLRMSPREVMLEGTTVRRAAPVPSRLSAFAGALIVVVLFLGGATWALFGRGTATTASADPTSHAATAAKTAVATATATTTSATSVATVSSAEPAPVAAAVEVASSTSARDAPVLLATTRTSSAAPRPAAAASSLTVVPAATPRASATSVVVPVAPPAASTSRTDLSPIQ